MRSGACADASESVNDVIRSIRAQQQRPFEITPELEAWLLEAADKPLTLLTRDDFKSNATRFTGPPKRT